MTMQERLEWLFIGMAIGYTLGYAVRGLRANKQSETDVNVNENDERGFMRYAVMQDIAIVLALGLTLFAAFSAAKTNQEIKQVVQCNETYLSKNLAADTTRADYLRTRLQANADLQKDQAAFLKELIHKRPGDPTGTKATSDYLDSLSKFLAISKKESNLKAYPTVEELNQCLDK